MKVCTYRVVPWRALDARKINVFCSVTKESWELSITLFWRNTFTSTVDPCLTEIAHSNITFANECTDRDTTCVVISLWCATVPSGASCKRQPWWWRESETGTRVSWVLFKALINCCLTLGRRDLVTLPAQKMLCQPWRVLWWFHRCLWTLNTIQALAL